MEDAARGEHAEAVVAVECDDVRHTVLDEARAQIGLRVRGIVDVDLDVRILTFELLGRLLEPVRGLGLELEEIKCDLPIAGPRAASRRAQADRDRARRGTSSFQRAP